MTSSASSSTKNPPRKLARTNVIYISSNKSSPLQENNLISTTITTTLSLSLTPPKASQTSPSQPIEASPLAPRTLLFSTPPSLPHPYLNSLDDLPPRSANPPPPPLDQSFYITLSSTTLKTQEHICLHCQRTQTLIHEVRDEMRFMLKRTNVKRDGTTPRLFPKHDGTTPRLVPKH
ncbi:hypothetical protein Tco_1119306 [Tanacetum coccineum]